MRPKFSFLGVGLSVIILAAYASQAQPDGASLPVVCESAIICEVASSSTEIGEGEGLWAATDAHLHPDYSFIFRSPLYNENELNCTSGVVSEVCVASEDPRGYRHFAISDRSGSILRYFHVEEPYSYLLSNFVAAGEERIVFAQCEDDSIAIGLRNWKPQAKDEFLHACINPITGKLELF